MPANETTDAASTQYEAASTSESSLAWGTTGFEPGGDVGLVARLTVGLIERDNPSTRERLWGLVSGDAPLDDILDELSSTGLKALPDFGLAQIEGSAIRVVARGRATVTAELGSGSSHEIDPSGVRTWIEELVEDVTSITITLSATDDDDAAPSEPSFAVLAGSVPARSLTRRYDVADEHADDAESGAGWTAGGATHRSAASDGPAPVSEVEAELSPAPDVDRAMVADIDEPVGAAGRESSASESSEPDPPAGDSWFEDQGSESSAIVPPQPATEGSQAADPQPSPRLDVAADPVPADPQPADPQPPPPSAGPAGPPPSGPGVGGAPPVALAPDSTVVVGPDDGPAGGPVSSIFDDDFDDHAAGSVTSAMPGDREGQTVGRSELDGVQAVAGHSAAPSDDAVVHGVLSFSNGERIDIDRSVLIGRNPKVAGAVGGSLPHIMKFDGPGQGLSRTHAEVRIEGGEVVIEDLQSTNGTEVQLPGEKRRRLSGGEPVVIVPGTLIDFGDELHCTLESAS